MGEYDSHTEDGPALVPLEIVARSNNTRQPQAAKSCLGHPASRRRLSRLPLVVQLSASSFLWLFLLLARISCGSPFAIIIIPQSRHVDTKVNPRAALQSLFPRTSTQRQRRWLRRSTTATIPSSASNNNDEDNEGGIGVGIDLGTTHSAIAFLSPDTRVPTIIPIPHNGRTMPSVITLLKPEPSGDDKDIASFFVVGQEAMALEATQGAYRNVKRILGRGRMAAQDSIDVVPYLVPSSSNTPGDSKGTGNYKKNNNKKNKNASKMSLEKQIQEAQLHPAQLYHLFEPSSNTNTRTRMMDPIQISSWILQRLLETAQEHTQQSITRAVIGVPAYFHDAQREATLQAAQRAGISKVKLLREPEAAALAYEVGKQQQQQQQQGVPKKDENDEELVLVFDLGGGTYDVSMLLVGGGLTEIITTSGDSSLGGSDFDARVAQHLRKVLVGHGGLTASSSVVSTHNPGDATVYATDAIVRSAEQVRIYLSNNRRVNMALPLEDKAWCQLSGASDVILPLDYDKQQKDAEPLTLGGTTNGTHVLCSLTRREMEKLCEDEFLRLLRPIREVAIMAGALLPGDTSPQTVEAAMQMEEEYDSSLMFDDFYNTDNSESNENNDNDDDGKDERLLLQLQTSVDEMEVRAQKKAQQKGRKKARDIAKQERKYRQEKRRIADQIPAADVSDVKVRDGISGRPISRVVLVGGATRMPTIGRILAALTGVVPQKTVNPDEAVALGCAVHVGVLDGQDDFGTVLNPMQAAILRAVAEQQQKQGLLSNDLDDDEDFDTVEFF